MFPSLLPILKTYISKNDTLIVGVSGGPDSTALLYVLLEFSDQIPCKIIVAHVNHGIRGKNSDRDENFVKELAKKHSLKFEVKRIKLVGKSALEERGRNFRRDFFEKLKKRYKAKWILTAHTQDDQIETIIFNFLRGSGPAGLAGMKVAENASPTTSGGGLKPFLFTPKSEILAYLKSKKLSFCIDATNKDTRFNRNFIRGKIIPLLSKINPNFQKTILRNSAIFGGIKDFLKTEAQNFLPPPLFSKKDGVGDMYLFSLKEFEKLPEALKSEVIQEAYLSAVKSKYSLPMLKIQEIIKLFKRGIGNKKILCSEKGFLVKKGKAFLCNK